MLFKGGGKRFFGLLAKLVNVRNGYFAAIAGFIPARLGALFF